MHKRYKIIIFFIVVGILSTVYYNYKSKKYNERFQNTLEVINTETDEKNNKQVEQFAGNIINNEISRNLDDTKLIEIKKDIFKSISQKSLLLANSTFTYFNLDWFNDNVPIFYNVIDDKDTEIKTDKPFLKEGLNNTKDFGLIFMYSGGQIEDKVFFKMPLTSELDFSVQVINNQSIDSKLIISYLNSKYIFEVGNMNINRIYTIIVSDYSSFGGLSNEVKLFIDGTKIEHIRIDDVKTNNNGTCPDGWVNLGNNKCGSNNNSSIKCNLNEIEITDKTNRNHWINKCGMGWNNCKKLEINQTAPEINQTGTNKNSFQNLISECKIKEDYSIENINKAIVNHLSSSYTICLISNPKQQMYSFESLEQKGLALTNEMKFIFNFSPEIERALQESCSKTMNEEYKRIGIDFNDESTIQKLKTYLSNVVNPSSSTVNNNDKKQCFFNNQDICIKPECSNINWDKPENVNIICKSMVNDYCRDNGTDSGCNKLRELRKKELQKVAETPIVYHPSVALPNLVKNCENCNTSVDLSKLKQ